MVRRLRLRPLECENSLGFCNAVEDGYRIGSPGNSKGVPEDGREDETIEELLAEQGN